MALVPSTSSQKPPPKSSICALINDRDNSLLNGLVDRLGSLEDGALIPMEENDDGIRHYQFRLDTKYYVADVPVYTFPTFEALLHLMKSTEQIQINALIICANRNELKAEFLARILQYTRGLDLECAEVKALVLKEDGLAMDKEQIVMDLVNDAQLQNFCIHKSIELIPLQNSRNSSDKSIDEDEEGAIGLARVVEILETVRWPGLRMKPNPLGRTAHLNRLMQFIQQREGEEDEFNGFENEDRRHHNSKEINFDNEFTQRSNNSKLVNGETQKLAPPLELDYPDSDDEAAIMEWFDKTENDDEMKSSNSTANKEKEKSRIAPNNASSNFVNENEAEKNGGINNDDDDICHELMQNISSKDPFQLNSQLNSIFGSINTIRQQNNWKTASRNERIAASEGLTYSVLGAISPTIAHQSQQPPKKPGTTMEQRGTESTETGSNSNAKVKKKKNN